MTVCETAREKNWDLLLLFGSRARGEATASSDYDIAILAGAGERVVDGLYHALPSGNLDVAWLDEASWLLWQEVARDGVPLYDRTGNLFAQFRIEAQLRSWDAGVWRQRNRRFVDRVLEGLREMNRDLVDRKAALLAQYIGELEPIIALSQERFLRDPMVHHAAERLVELLVECATAINTEVSQSLAGIPPSDYYSSFFSLASAGWIDSGAAQSLGQWARIRNTLVHRYETIGLEELHQQLQGSTLTWRAYLKAIRFHLEAAGG